MRLWSTHVGFNFLFVIPYENASHFDLREGDMVITAVFRSRDSAISKLAIHDVGGGRETHTHSWPSLGE